MKQSNWSIHPTIIYFSAAKTQKSLLSNYFKVEIIFKKEFCIY